MIEFTGKIELRAAFLSCSMDVSPHLKCARLLLICFSSLQPLRFPLLIAPMTEPEALQIFRDAGALLEGHFILRSGLRSRQFFQCALALQDMPTVEKLGAAIAEKVRHLQPRTVIAPAMGGLVIGQEVARQLR